MNRRKKKMRSSWKQDRAYNEVQNILEAKKYAAKGQTQEIVREA